MQDFDKVYSEYFSEVYKFVFSLCRDAALTEEITQETFFKALRNIEKFNGNCKLSSWLCQIAKNTFYSYAKKNKRQVNCSLELITSDENIEEQFVDKETAYTIHKVFSNFPIVSRRMIELNVTLRHFCFSFHSGKFPVIW